MHGQNLYKFIIINFTILKLIITFKQFEIRQKYLPKINNSKNNKEFWQINYIIMLQLIL